MELSREQLLDAYRYMRLIREFEERIHLEFATGEIPGFVHLYAGEEASAVAICMNLGEQDYIASTHRGHGHCIAKGVDVKPMMAELYGKSTGTNRGKGGSMHITDVRAGMLGVNPIVGAGVPHALGAALSARVRKTDQVAAAFFGDGAANIGVVHESLNMAAIWKLPVLFICENNGYAQATPAEYATAGPSIANRAAGYGIPGVSVDGQDVIAVWQAASEAVDRARSGGGPTLIECATYRYFGHHQGDDPLRYRTAEEQRAAMDRDCVKRFRSFLLGKNLVEASELDAMDALNAQRMDEAVSFAESSPLPNPEELYTDVYVG